MPKKKNTDEANEAQSAGGETAAESAAFRMHENSTIHFVGDWGPEKSPKKSPQTLDLWNKYREGMTVQEAMSAGLTRSNIRRDRRAGFITVDTSHPQPAKPEKAEAESETADA